MKQRQGCHRPISTLCVFFFVFILPIHGISQSYYLECPSGYALCPNGLCCPSGTVCTSNGCDVVGEWCGRDKYCQAGTTCTSDGVGCLKSGEVYCGYGRSCPMGYACSIDSCVSTSNSDGRYNAWTEKFGQSDPWAGYYNTLSKPINEYEKYSDKAVGFFRRDFSEVQSMVIFVLLTIVGILLAVNRSMATKGMTRPQMIAFSTITSFLSSVVLYYIGVGAGFTLLSVPIVGGLSFVLLYSIMES